MKNNWVSPLYVMNIVVQAFFDLVVPIGLGYGIGYLLETRAGAGGWVYALFMILGVFIGLFTMCKSIIRSMQALERLERQRQDAAADKKDEPHHENSPNSPSIKRENDDTSKST